MELVIGDIVSVYNYWYRNKEGKIVNTSNRDVEGITPWVNIEFKDGSKSGMIPANVCKLIKKMENQFPVLIEKDPSKDYKIAFDISHEGQFSMFAFAISTISNGMLTIEQSGLIKDIQVNKRYSNEKFASYIRNLATHFGIAIPMISEQQRTNSRRVKEFKQLLEDQKIKLNINK